MIFSFKLQESELAKHIACPGTGFSAPPHSELSPLSLYFEAQILPFGTTVSCFTIEPGKPIIVLEAGNALIRFGGAKYEPSKTVWGVVFSRLTFCGKQDGRNLNPAR